MRAVAIGLLIAFAIVAAEVLAGWWQGGWW
jgi:hypothetical protein